MKDSVELVLGIIGRGAAVERKDNHCTFQEKDLIFVEELANNFEKIVYSPFCYKKESKFYEMAYKIYKAELTRNNVEIFELYIRDNFKKFDKLRKRINQALSIKRISKFLNKVDIVLIFWPSPISLLTIIMCKLKGKKYAIYKGGSWAELNPQRGKIKGISFKKILGRIIERIILTISPVVFIRGATNNKKNFFYVKGNTKFDIEDLFYREDTCGKEEIIILNIAPINPVKGIDIIIKSVKILVDKGYKVRFYQIGAYYKENYDKILKLVKDLKIRDRVKFLGYIHEKEKIIEIMRKSDIFVLSSYMEGFPRVIVEAMSQSLPVITTPVGGIKDLLKNEEHVLFFKVGDQKDLSEKIIKVIENETIRKKLIFKGYNFAKEEFNLLLPAEFISKILKTRIFKGEKE